MPVRDAPVSDVGPVLEAAADRLCREFEGIGRDTVERLLRSSYDQFASRATVFTFLPLLAERAVRQHLRAPSAAPAGKLISAA